MQKNSLRKRFVTAFLINKALFLTLILMLNFSTMFRASDGLIDEKMQTTGTVFGNMIFNAVVVSDLAMVDDAVTEIIRNKTFDAVLVWDNQKRLISKGVSNEQITDQFLERIRGSKKHWIEEQDIRYAYRSIPLQSSGQKVGTLELLLETTPHYNVLTDNIRVTIILVGLFLLVSYFVADFIANRVSIQLTQLTRIAEDVADNKTVAFPDENEKDDEFSVLFSSMRRMQNNIAQRTENLQKTLNVLQQFVRAMDESAIVSKTSPNGVITFANRKFCEISGYELHELMGQRHSIVRHPDNSDELYKELWETITAKKVYHNTLKNMKKDGSAYYVDVTIVPLLDTNGHINEYIAIRYDVTDIVESRNSAVAAEHAKDLFLSNMSHEIRTPLNAIMGFVHLLQEEIQVERSRSYLDVIEKNSHTLMHIINDILDFSKIQSGKLHIEMHPFDPLEEFSVAIKLFSPMAKEKKINFLARFDPMMARCIESDVIRIKQIMFNYLSNAFKFTAEGGEVSVMMEYDTARKLFVLEVNDNGIGIPKEKLETIFSAFEQADSSTTRKFGGTGLGLAIVARLAELMGGSVSVESQEGSGSRFSVLLPAESCEQEIDFSECPTDRVLALWFDRQTALTENLIYYLERLHCPYEIVSSLAAVKPEQTLLFVPDAEVETYVKQAQREAIAILPFGDQRYMEFEYIRTLAIPFTSLDIVRILNTPLLTQEAIVQDEKLRFEGRVLIAEDNVTNQLLLKLLLDEYEIEYDVVADGLLAYEAYKNQSYNLILMDENMPNCSGLEAFAKIRKYEAEHERSVTPVVAVTANALMQDKERFFEAGMDGFLAKPIQVHELEQLLKRFLPLRMS